ncbi:MAG: head GIN domain-containing protein [Bacteroidota bacterium]
MKATFLGAILFASFWGGIFGSLSAQPQDHTAIDQPLRTFGQISLFGLFEMELIPASEARLVISSDDVDPSKVKVVQRGDLLKISLMRSLINDEEIDLTLYYVPNRLTSIQVGGGAQIHSSARLQAEDLRIRAGSGSQVFLDLELERLDATASEGGHLSLRGTAQSIDCNANTGGIIEGHRMIGQSVFCRAGTGGEVSIHAENLLDAKASTGGSIRYGGDAPEVNIRTILGGEVMQFLP